MGIKVWYTVINVSFLVHTGNIYRSWLHSGHKASSKESQNGN